MMIHDLETRFLEAEYEVGIGKGTLDRPGELDRRVVKDYKTPVGNYQITQKKTPKIWKEAEGREMDKEYGGVNGGMLVLSGPWHPEIAIHGTLFETTGKTSNGCIRVSNALMKKLMESIPTGSFVIVTQ